MRAGAGAGRRARKGHGDDVRGDVGQVQVVPPLYEPAAVPRHNVSRSRSDGGAAPQRARRAPGAAAQGRGRRGALRAYAVAAGEGLEVAGEGAAVRISAAQVVRGPGGGAPSACCAIGAVLAALGARVAAGAGARQRLLQLWFDEGDLEVAAELLVLEGGFIVLLGDGRCPRMHSEAGCDNLGGRSTPVGIWRGV